MKIDKLIKSQFKLNIMYFCLKIELLLKYNIIILVPNQTMKRSFLHENS